MVCIFHAHDINKTSLYFYFRCGGIRFCLLLCCSCFFLHIEMPVYSIVVHSVTGRSFSMLFAVRITAFDFIKTTKNIKNDINIHHLNNSANNCLAYNHHLYSLHYGSCSYLKFSSAKGVTIETCSINFCVSCIKIKYCFQQHT